MISEGTEYLLYAKNESNTGVKFWSISRLDINIENIKLYCFITKWGKKVILVHLKEKLLKIGQREIKHLLN